MYNMYCLIEYLNSRTKKQILKKKERKHVFMNKLVENDDEKHRLQYCVTFCFDCLDFKGLLKTRTITKVLIPLVSGPSFWDCISDMQEKCECNGKHLLLFNQYLMP